MPLISREEEYLQAFIDGDGSENLPPPMSRNEAILKAIVDKDDTSTLNPPQSREEALLIEVAKIIEQGGGGEVVVRSLDVDANGTYTAESGCAYSPVRVNVPNTYQAADENKVVNNSALVAQTSLNINQNGTHDTTLNNEVVVNVPETVIESLSITENGTYTPSSGYAYGPVNVSVPGTDHTEEDEIISRSISGTYENSRVTSAGSYAFYGCSSLTTASFPACTAIGSSAFYGCSSLTTVSFPACTRIGNNAFGHCLSLTIVSFPACTTIGSHAFSNCTKLTTVSFPACTSIGSNAFYSCSSLTTVSFPACTSIGSNAFGCCSSLAAVSFPACTSIGSNAFQLCYNFISLYLLGSSVARLANSNAFNSTPFMGYVSSTSGVWGSIYVPASLLGSYKTATNWAYYSMRFVSVE